MTQDQGRTSGAIEMVRRCQPVMVALLACCLLSCTPTSSSSVGVYVETEVSSVQEWDPLIVKIAIKNLHRQPLQMYLPSGDTNNLVVKMSGLGGVSTITSGLHACGPCGKPIVLNQDEKYVRYETIHTRGREFIFSRSGDYWIRAHFRPKGRPPSFVSVPVHIHVQGLGWRMKKAVESVVDMRFDSPIVDVFPHSDRAKAAAFENTLPESNWKQTLQWRLAIDAVRRAETENERREAIDDLNRLRKKLGAVTNEVIDLELAKVHVNKEEWDEAARVVNGIKERSYHADWLKRNIKDGREQEKRRDALFPEDRRLDKEVTYQSQGGTLRELLGDDPPSRRTTLAEILKLISEQANVSFTAAPEFRDREVGARAVTYDLRSEMLQWSDATKGKWIKRGDGYHLMPPVEEETHSMP